MPSPTPTKLSTKTRRQLHAIGTLTMNEINRVFREIGLRLDSVDAVGQRPDVKGKVIVNLGTGNRPSDSIRFDQIFNEFVLSSDAIIYFGDPNVDDSWRIKREDDNWNIERRESGSWTKKGYFSPS